MSRIVFDTLRRHRVSSGGFAGERPRTERAPLPSLEMAEERKGAGAAGRRRAKHRGRLHGFRPRSPGGDQVGFQRQHEELKAVLAEKAREIGDPAGSSKKPDPSEPRHAPKPYPPTLLPPGRRNRPGTEAPGPPGTVLERAGGLRKMKPAAPSMRHAPTDAPRRELSKSVEFLKIGSLHQILWP